VTSGTARSDLLVVGIGNTLREDDGVGIVLAARLAAQFGGALACRELFAADLGLAEELGGFAELLVLDALAPAAASAPASASASASAPTPGATGEPYIITPLAAGPRFNAGGGLTTHTFDWGFVLAAARDLFGATPKAQLLGIRAVRFGFGETLSPACADNAERAFAFLVDYCRQR